MVRQGAIDNPPKTPFIMGFECAGVVEALGEGVTDLKVRMSSYYIILVTLKRDIKTPIRRTDAYLCCYPK